MAGEISTAYLSQQTLYFLAENRNSQVWNTASGNFQVLLSGNIANYQNSMLEQGITGIYAGTFPAAITPGIYGIVIKRQVGGGPTDTDPNITAGDYQWNGVATLPLSDLATSGQVGILAPIRIFRGQSIPVFPFFMVSSADHVTPFTSGICSGQISRDGGAFGPLQSGVFTEVGLGSYGVPLTSGDLLANAVSLVFTAVGVSGGLSDPRNFTLILQRSSGS